MGRTASGRALEEEALRVAVVAYWLDVGTTSQANAYYSSGSLPITTTSETVNSLPTDGSEGVVTVYTQFSNGGTWYANTYYFTAQ